MINLIALFGGGRGIWLRQELLAAIEEAYDENCRRFADDLGDNATTLGIALFHNITFLVEQRLEGAGGITIIRPNNSFMVEVDGYYLHIYKARPGCPRFTASGSTSRTSA